MNKARSQAIAKAYIKSKFNGAEAGLQVFNTTKRKHASVMMRKALKSPQVQNDIQKELENAGLSKEYLNKTMYEAIEINKQGKPSQAVLAQLLIQSQKIYNYIPKDNKEVKKQEKRILLDKDYNILRTELKETLTSNQELLEDL